MPPLVDSTWDSLSASLSLLRSLSLALHSSASSKPALEEAVRAQIKLKKVKGPRFRS